MAEKLGGLVKIQNNVHRWSSQGGNGNKKILSQTNNNLYSSTRVTSTEDTFAHIHIKGQVKLFLQNVVDKPFRVLSEQDIVNCANSEF